ncbi:MAG TPA: hypothetical protein VG650_08280 [Mycobacteriales bacterium]|nr:hypothetical protein [Mycobacteriales bacterium]
MSLVAWNGDDAVALIDVAVASDLPYRLGRLRVAVLAKSISVRPAHLERDGGSFATFDRACLVGLPPDRTTGNRVTES